ncbi:MAG: DUF1003 domain-containing protein [Bacteroidota bacterium]
MQRTFVSDLSKKTYPLSEKISCKSIRSNVMDEIKKEAPDFKEDGAISLNELNQYRYRFIQKKLSTEIGDLTALEQQVLKNLEAGGTLSDKLQQDESKDDFTFGQRLADKIASFGGSWTFILSFLFFILIWICTNVFLLLKNPFDPYPFILLNLILSCLAALQAPVIMMSQNRQEEKDRERSRNDYMINLKSELEIRMLHEKMDHLIINQQSEMLEIQQVQVEMMREIMEKIERLEK